MSDQQLTLKCEVHFRRGAKGRVEMKAGPRPEAAAPAPSSRIPKIARLMALAIKFEGMLNRGEVKDYAELAWLGQVSRARITQIMNLLNLAPDIQEAILFLPAVERGRDPLKEWQVRPVAAEPRWSKQRRKWGQHFALPPARGGFQPSCSPVSACCGLHLQSSERLNSTRKRTDY